jgi:leucine-rich repeat transmembrane neuronal protein 1/2
MAQSGGEPIVSSSDEVSLYFKTRQATGMLFYTGIQIFMAINLVQH